LIASFSTLVATSGDALVPVGFDREEKTFETTFNEQHHFVGLALAAVAVSLLAI